MRQPRSTRLFKKAEMENHVNSCTPSGEVLKVRVPSKAMQGEELRTEHPLFVYEDVEEGEDEPVAPSKLMARANTIHRRTALMRCLIRRINQIDAEDKKAWGKICSLVGIPDASTTAEILTAVENKMTQFKELETLQQSHEMKMQVLDRQREEATTSSNNRGLKIEELQKQLEGEQKSRKAAEYKLFKQDVELTCLKLDFLKAQEERGEAQKDIEMQRIFFEKKEDLHKAMVEVYQAEVADFKREHLEGLKGIQKNMEDLTSKFCNDLAVKGVQEELTQEQRRMVDQDFARYKGGLQEYIRFGNKVLRLVMRGTTRSLRERISTSSYPIRASTLSPLTFAHSARSEKGDEKDAVEADKVTSEPPAKKSRVDSPGPKIPAC